MSKLHVSRQLACPVGQAPGFVMEFFDQRRDAHGTPTMALRAPIQIPGLPEMELARDCIVQVHPHHEAGDMTKRYRVTWQSTGGGPFPKFSGILEIANAEDYSTCVLDLSGTYEPPLGAVGAAFDFTVGHAIAESTGKELLERVGSYVEQSSRSVETAKRNRHETQTT